MPIIKRYSSLTIAGLLLFVMVIALLMIATRYDSFIKQNSFGKTNQSEIRFYYDNNNKNPTPVSDRILPASPVPSTLPQHYPETPSVIHESTKATQSAIEKGAVHCVIQDILGDSIREGTVRIDGQIKVFQNGEIILEDITQGVHTLAADAEGYQSATMEIDSRDTNHVLFQLDYLCDYKIVVYTNDTRKTPASGAEICLFKSIPIARPIKHSQTVYFCSFEDEYKPYALRYNGEDITIVASKTQSAFATTFDAPIPFEKNDFSFTPIVNDTVVSIGSCSWNGNNESVSDIRSESLPLQKIISHRARIIDTLSLVSHSLSARGVEEFVRLKRENRIGRTKMVFPSWNERGKETEIFKTDEAGTCFIPKKTPGLYFVQARQEGKFSNIRPLYPTSGGCVLTLSSSCELLVYVHRGGISDDYHYKNRYTMWKGTQITLKPLDSNKTGFYSNAIDTRGRTSFELVPFGTYRLEAIPPAITNIKHITKEIALSEPHQTEHLYFQDWNKHRIEGVVSRMDTMEPLEGIQVELLELWGGGYESCAIERSNRDGNFVFDNVPEGRYKIACSTKDLQDKKLYPYNESLIDSRQVKERPFIGRELDEMDFDYETNVLTVTDQPIYHVQVLLVACIETRFSGKVTYSDSRPAPGAFLEVRPFQNSMRCQSKYTFPNPPLSNENGLFDFVMFSKATLDYSEVEYTGEIRAREAKIIEPQWREYQTAEGMSLVRSEGNMTVNRALGSKEIQFHLGDKLENIHIVIDQSHIFDMEGRVRTEANSIPTHLELSAWQIGDKWIPGEYDPATGSFLVRGLEIEDTSLMITNIYREDKESILNERHYLDENIVVKKEEIQQMIRNSNADRKCKIEILVKESGYIQGKVVDRYREPVFPCYVLTDPDIGKAKWAQTDSNGIFVIYGLTPGQEYNLYVGEGNRETPMESIFNLKPNIENLIIQID